MIFLYRFRACTEPHPARVLILRGMQKHQLIQNCRNTRGLDAHCVEREMAQKRVWNPTTTEFRWGVNCRDGFFHVFYRFFFSDLKQKVEEKQDPDNNDIVTL